MFAFFSGATDSTDRVSLTFNRDMKMISCAEIFTAVYSLEHNEVFIPT